MTQTPLIRLADPADLDEVHALDRHLTRDALAETIRRKQILLAIVESRCVGILRFGWLWDLIPFMNLLRVSPDRRRTGIGRALVTNWQSRMQKAGCPRVLTSTQADETAQHFYRKLGYRDAGGLVLPGQALELFLLKDLTPPSALQT
ncbi:MAG: GNAT family N-acetyltransferase [Phycisphaerae bacterium]